MVLPGDTAEEFRSEICIVEKNLKTCDRNRSWRDQENFKYEHLVTLEENKINSPTTWEDCQVNKEKNISFFFFLQVRRQSDQRKKIFEKIF